MNISPFFNTAFAFALALFAHACTKTDSYASNQEAVIHDGRNKTAEKIVETTEATDQEFGQMEMHLSARLGDVEFRVTGTMCASFNQKEGEVNDQGKPDTEWACFEALPDSPGTHLLENLPTGVNFWVEPKGKYKCFENDEEIPVCTFIESVPSPFSVEPSATTLVRMKFQTGDGTIYICGGSRAATPEVLDAGNP